MKIVLAFVVASLAVATISAEECRNVDGCDHVTCPESDYLLECHNRQCTCTKVASNCIGQSDCSGTDCRFGWHCVDATCRCGFGFGGIGR